MNGIVEQILNSQATYFVDLPSKSRDIYLWRLKEFFKVFKNEQKQTFIITIQWLRGVGKTVLVKQFLKPMLKKAVYIKADQFALDAQHLEMLIEFFREKWIKIFAVDEINSIPNWERALKNIYDKYQDLFVIVTGSWFARGQKSFLARRHLEMLLPPLSFREYLNLIEWFDFDVVSLLDIAKNASSLMQEILTVVPDLGAKFRIYLEEYNFPFCDKLSCFDRLDQNIKKVIFEDMALTYPFRTVTLKKVYNLLNILGVVKHMDDINYEFIKQKTGLDFKEIPNILQIMEEFNLIELVPVFTDSVGVAVRSQFKIYLSAPSFYTMFAAKNFEKPSTQLLRESFVVSMLKRLGKLWYPKRGKKNPDFVFKNQDGVFLFEVGGKSKKSEQLEGVKADFKCVIKDSLDADCPLWLFGFVR